MHGFFKMKITDKEMSRVMYALLKTDGKLVNSFGIGIKQYDRNQSKGFSVDVVVDIKDDMVETFEELAEVKLKTSSEFQGDLHLNMKNQHELECPVDWDKIDLEFNWVAIDENGDLYAYPNKPYYTTFKGGKILPSSGMWVTKNGDYSLVTNSLIPNYKPVDATKCLWHRPKSENE